MDRITNELKYPVKSLEKGLSILELMIAEGREFGLTEIVKNLGMQKGTAHRILSTLKSHRFIQQDPGTKKYGLGSLAFEMGSALTEGNFLRKAMRPALRELSEQCKEAISASILEYDEIKYIARFESRELLRVSIREGTRFPAHCTATGKILLSALPEEYLEKLYNTKRALARLTENSIPSFEKLTEELRRVRENDVAYDFEEALVGVNCVARPVRRKGGQVVAAISISGPVSRMMREKMSEFSELLLGTTRRLSHEIGFVENTTAQGR